MLTPVGDFPYKSTEQKSLELGTADSTRLQHIVALGLQAFKELSLSSQGAGLVVTLTRACRPPCKRSKT